MLEYTSQSICFRPFVSVPTSSIVTDEHPPHPPPRTESARGPPGSAAWWASQTDRPSLAPPSSLAPRISGRTLRARSPQPPGPIWPQQPLTAQRRIARARRQSVSIIHVSQCPIRSVPLVAVPRGAATIAAIGTWPCTNLLVRDRHPRAVRTPGPRPTPAGRRYAPTLTGRPPRAVRAPSEQFPLGRRPSEPGEHDMQAQTFLERHTPRLTEIADVQLRIWRFALRRRREIPDSNCAAVTVRDVPAGTVNTTSIPDEAPLSSTRRPSRGHPRPPNSPAAAGSPGSDCRPG